ncbi:zinc transporter ZIP10-like isoform X2 [Argopecten irradians]|uniref:zinc transporter ZIP10-like isoform X2 n=1 Tax=Argopecten irradians TaxID=31199 RepID=UPI0037137A18
MCFSPKSRLCLICLTIHTLTCLPINAHANGAPNPLSSNSTHEIPNNTGIHDHHGMNEEELRKAQEIYVQDLVDRFGSNGVISFDGIIHLLESLGMGLNVLPKHVHTGHKHHSSDSHAGHNHDAEHEEHSTDSHAGHSHDADHAEHLHDSDHDKHHPDTNHEDHHHTDTEDEDEHHDHDHSNHNDHDNHHNHTDINHKHTNDSDTRKRRSSKASLSGRSKKSEDSHYHFGDGHTTSDDNEKCDDLFEDFHIHESETFSPEKLLLICPGILSTLSRAKCRENLEQHHHVHPATQPVADAFKHISAEVWGYSTIAIIIISLVGLLGVAVVPIMQKVFYNHLLLFLVALAVGALSGDAMLHLLPHALQGGHDHSSDSHESEGDEMHNTAVLKGLCGMGAIFLFFTMERVLSIVTNLKRKQKKESDDVDDEHTNIPLTECGAMRVTDPDCKEQVMGIHPGQKALTNFAESSHKKCSHSHESHDDKDRQFEMVDAENPSSVLSHSHNHHGHSHILPTSVASIAWMVILGDGIHNFCDGLAIGAAFSNSITGGFSTSVAVFCHELPHEIGDFAVLLRAGMTVKQAVMYNCVSSILAFIGMLIGVAIGNFGDSITWVFISVAGMFLYIALVDMLPELTAVDTKQGEHPFFHLFIQVIGMILGASIMLIIALYEKNLMNILEPV